jgi:16S rRNA (uracil1498-N3)-methyltransferase
MPRVFVNPDDIIGKEINICGEDVKHITTVLRLSVDDTITICDGIGKDFETVIVNMDKEKVKVKIIGEEVSSGEPPINVTLYQGLPKADKMEYIIQKAVEMGIYEIVPVITNRAVVKIKNDNNEKNKLTRWRRIAYEAAKQSNRGRIPNILAPISFDEALEKLDKNDLKIFAYEEEKLNKLKNMLKNGENIRNIGILIGPEGGFEEKEVIKCKLKGLMPISLGPRILRTETAGLAVLSILMYEFGDI